MKNIVASILLILALIQSLYLYRSGERYQDSLVQEPMTASSLHTEGEETAEEDKTEKVEDEAAEDAEEEKAAEEEKEPEKTEEKEKEKKEEAQEEKLPSREEDLKALQEVLEEKISGISGEWALHVTYLPTGEGFDIGSSSMTAASLIKLYIAGAYLEAVEKGNMEDLYDAAFTNMISLSDNDAANKLINLLGMDYINDFIKNHGFEDTRLNRLMLADNGLENYTSVNDCAGVLEQIYAGTFVSEEASARILSAMKNQRVVTKIPAGLPEGVESANKTGELLNVQNDTAIVFAPGGDYVFCVMSQKVAPGNAETQIVDMSKTIYEALGKAENMSDNNKEEKQKKKADQG
jgi:N-acetylmuramoyl-L-alanine amidase/beta-lactamase class A